LRVIIAGVFKSEHGYHIDPEALACIRQIHLISSAAASSSSDLRKIAADFSVTLRNIVSSFPPSLQNLLDANFYESTGDYRAVELLSSLKILQLREGARDLAQEQKAALRQQLLELRQDNADRIEAMLNTTNVPPDHHVDS
jgi:hypothetical protein